MEKREKKVSISQMQLQDTPMNDSSPSIGVRQSRMSFTNEMILAGEVRKNMKVSVEVDGQQVDVTPKLLSIEMRAEKFEKIRESIKEQFITVREQSADVRSIGGSSHISGRTGIGVMRMSVDDILNGIASGMFRSDSSDTSLADESCVPIQTKYTLPFIKVFLTLSDSIVLFEQRSLTALRNTPEGELVEEDNREYDYLTIGKGKVRRRSDAEVQTDYVLSKTRAINTICKKTAEKATYVSFFEMFDTYEELSKPLVSLAPVEAGSAPRQALVKKNLTPLQQYATIIWTAEFRRANRLLKRMLASNVHEENQRRFRNMTMPDRMSMNLEYRYTLRLLFQYVMPRTDGERKSVTDMSFNAKNGDILAVGYGIYSFSAMHVPKRGIVCVWSIKNPAGPERLYHYGVPVVSVEFSPFLPTLLAVGLYDGSVQVRDITRHHATPVAISQRITSPSVEPIMAIKWIKQSKSGDTNEPDPFLTLSQDGSVTKYRLINSPYLLGFKQMVLDRIEGNPEGLLVKRTGVLTQQANRHPQGLGLTVHPLYKDIYYVLTDEGCLHKCSTNYTHQYLEVWKAHNASVNCMDFSPWSPKLFLTCGNDWCIRIWIDGIFKPLLTLSNQMAPIHCAYWSQTHSTVIMSVNRRTFDIWDIRRNLLKPVSSTTLESSYHTMAQISRCGRSVAIGNERGVVLMAALDDFPFPPHFQYDELEKALYKAISTYPDLIIELKSVGFFGYPGKSFVRST